MDTTKVFAAGEPDHAVPPGDSIREFLDELGMTQRELAKRLALSPKHVNQLVQGVVSLSPEVADRLALVTGLPARLWNRMEADYQSTQRRLRKKIAAQELGPWVKSLPIRELVHRGVLPATPDDNASRIQQSLAFFGVADVGAYHELYERPAAAFRQAKAYKANPSAVAAWLRLGELAGHDIKCGPYNKKGFQESLGKLRELTVLRPAVFLPLMQKTCADNGIAVVVVPEISGARASGVTKWLAVDKALIVLSGRYGHDDQMWFTFFHEVGHLLKHGRADIWIEDDRLTGDPREEEADRFARDLLIPPQTASALTRLRSLKDIQRFAAEIGIAASIVVGRLHHERMWPYTHGNGLRHRLDMESLASI